VAALICAANIDFPHPVTPYTSNRFATLNTLYACIWS
jgi:hypothetical protein